MFNLKWYFIILFNRIYKKDLQIQDSDILKSLTTINEVLLCISKNEGENHISIITKYNDSLFKNADIDSTSFFYKIIDSICIASTSKAILNTIKSKANIDFDKLSQTVNTNVSFSLYLNNKSADSLGYVLFNQSKMANSLMLDASITSGEINLNGIAITNESKPELLSIFNRTSAQENALSDIAPNDSKGFLSFTFNNYDILKSNIKPIQKQKLIPL